MPNEFTIPDWTKLGGLLRDARSWLARVEAGHRGAELEPLLRLVAALDLSLTLRPAVQAQQHVDRADETIPHEAGDGLRAASQARRAAWGLPVDGDRATTDE